MTLEEMTPAKMRARKEDLAVQLKGLDLVEKIGEETETVADGVVALVHVTDQGLRGLVAALGGIETIRGRDGELGPVGPVGPPGADGRPGQDGRDGQGAAPSPRVVAVEGERDFNERLVRARQVLSDGTQRRFDVRRDFHGRISAFVLSPGQEA